MVQLLIYTSSPGIGRQVFAVTVSNLLVSESLVTVGMLCSCGTGKQDRFVTAWNYDSQDLYTGKIQNVSGSKKTGSVLPIYMQIVKLVTFFVNSDGIRYICIDFIEGQASGSSVLYWGWNLKAPVSVSVVSLPSISGWSAQDLKFVHTDVRWQIRCLDEVVSVCCVFTFNSCWLPFLRHEGTCHLWMVVAFPWKL